MLFHFLFLVLFFFLLFFPFVGSSKSGFFGPQFRYDSPTFLIKKTFFRPVSGSTLRCHRTIIVREADSGEKCTSIFIGNMCVFTSNESYHFSYGVLQMVSFVVVGFLTEKVSCLTSSSRLLWKKSWKSSLFSSIF